MSAATSGQTTTRARPALAAAERPAMGANVPDGRLNQIQWFEDRITAWSENPPAIGLTAAMVSAFTTELADARSAFTSTQLTRAAAKNATQSFHTLSDSMRTSGGELVNAIKSFAEATNDDTVYTAANVSPAKETRSPAPTPLTPHDIKTSLNNDGSIEISFKGTGPTGTMYMVYSKPFGTATYSWIGQADAHTKTFTDFTVTPGTQSVTYMIQAIRGNASSPWSEQVTTQFGVSADGVGLSQAA